MLAALDGFLENAMPALHIPPLVIVPDHSALVLVLSSAWAAAVTKSTSATVNVRPFIPRTVCPMAFCVKIAQVTHRVTSRVTWRVTFVLGEEPTV